MINIWIDFDVTLKDLEDAENNGCLLSKWLCYQFELLNSPDGSSGQAQIPSDKADSLFLSAEAGLGKGSDIYDISKFLLRSSDDHLKDCFYFLANFSVYCGHGKLAQKLSPAVLAQVEY